MNQGEQFISVTPMSAHTVITTIQPPTPSVLAMLSASARSGMGIVAIGDRKSPPAAWPHGVDFFSLERQRALHLKLATLLPENHYARKNIGYLLAIARQSPSIFDTDDDNSPLPSWKPRSLQLTARACLHSGWVNAYKWFSDEHIWPRGLPLNKAHHTLGPAPLGPPTEVQSPIQQGLANGSPDVDAVWRLLMDRTIVFRDDVSVYLPTGTWCPFNSQSTWWFPQAYPLLYLPSFVSFRMTDIWRSLIAQRCLWALGYGVVFHGAEMAQDRNPHNLLRDFEQEVPGYLANDRIREVLEHLPLLPGANEVGGNLHRCYEALIQANHIPFKEIQLVECWLNDFSTSAAQQG